MDYAFIVLLSDIMQVNMYNKKLNNNDDDNDDDDDDGDDDVDV